MKRTLLFCLCFIVIVKAKSQVILNEIYTDPGAGKHEFFELYNTSGSTVPMSLDDYSIVTFFELMGKKGFYVLDLPNLTINPQGYFVGSSALPFNYQGISNSSASDFSWNSPLLVANSGYMKKWVEGTTNLTDGNLFYDEAPLPANFNDFFYRRMAAGHSYCVFVYKNGALVNTFIGGTGGNATIITTVINMPTLNVDMVNPLSTDYQINWSTYATIPLEYCIQDAGSDNGFIRERDGACGMWDKSSAGVQHTPQQTNGGGPVDETFGTIAVSSVIIKGSVTTGSIVEYEVVSVATPTSFPVEMMIYLDNGNIDGQLDPADTYIESGIQNMLGEGTFSTQFFPWDENILIVVKSSAGCIDKIQFLPNTGTLAVKLSNFHGNIENRKAYLGWTVLQNEAADRYILEKSVNGRDFTAHAVLLASDKLGSETYGLFHNMDGADKMFYRLRIIDKSQQSEYSKTVFLQHGEPVANETLKLINNPVKDKISLNITSTVSQTAAISVYDLSGRKVHSQPVTLYAGSNMINIPLSSSFRQGMYVADLVAGAKRYTAKFIKE